MSAVSNITRRTTARREHADSDFDRQIEPLVPQLLGFFIRRVTDREDAADCLSETLIVLWRRQTVMPQEPSEARAWSFAIAARVLSNFRRGKLRHVALNELLVKEAFVAPIARSAPDELDAESLMAVLSESDRSLVMMVVLEGFSIQEAGKVLGLRPGSARMRYSRARQKLREALEKFDNT